MQKNVLIRKFNLYYTTTVGANLILHRREKFCVTMIKILLAFWTPCKYSVFKGYKEYWDFRNMIERITTIRNYNGIKAKLFISLYFTKVKWYFIPLYIYSNGKINHQKWVLLRDTCDYPTTSNAYFTMVSEPKLSDYMKGEDFQPPLNHF